MVVEQLPAQEVARSILELLALLLPVAAAFLGILIRTPQGESSDLAIIRSFTFFFVSSGIVILVVISLAITEFFIASGYPNPISTSLRGVVGALVLISGPMAGYGYMRAWRELRGAEAGSMVRDYLEKLRATSDEEGEDDGD